MGGGGGGRPKLTRTIKMLVFFSKNINLNILSYPSWKSCCHGDRILEHNWNQQSIFIRS